MPLPDCEAIKAACLQALQPAHPPADWQARYCAAVDPASVLALVTQLDAFRTADQAPETAAWVKLVRDLTGYLKLVTRATTDPVRDDLLLQAKGYIAQARR